MTPTELPLSAVRGEGLLVMTYLKKNIYICSCTSISHPCNGYFNKLAYNPAAKSRISTETWTATVPLCKRGWKRPYMQSTSCHPLLLPLFPPIKACRHSRLQQAGKHTQQPYVPLPLCRVIATMHLLVQLIKWVFPIVSQQYHRERERGGRV